MICPKPNRFSKQPDNGRKGFTDELSPSVTLQLSWNKTIVSWRNPLFLPFQYWKLKRSLIDIQPDYWTLMHDPVVLINWENKLKNIEKWFRILNQSQLCWPVWSKDSVYMSLSGGWRLWWLPHDSPWCGYFAITWSNLLENVFIVKFVCLKRLTEI